MNDAIREIINRLRRSSFDNGSKYIHIGLELRQVRE